MCQRTTHHENELVVSSGQSSVVGGQFQGASTRSESRSSPALTTNDSHVNDIDVHPLSKCVKVVQQHRTSDRPALINDIDRACRMRRGEDTEVQCVHHTEHEVPDDDRNLRVTDGISFAHRACG